MKKQDNGKKKIEAIKNPENITGGAISPLPVPTKFKPIGDPVIPNDPIHPES